MFTCKTTNLHKDFCALTQALDTELNARYGKEQALYDKHNVLDPIETALIGYEDNLPVACGCLKEIDETTVEIKRMFVQPNYRRRGISSRLLLELHTWAEESGFSYAQLETGKGQPEAIALYAKMGYVVIPNYEPYVGMENSVCMRKVLRS